MHIRSDVITHLDLGHALYDTRPIAPSIGLILESTVKGRVRQHTHKLSLEGWGARHTRQSQRGDTKAATWMDWGWFLAVLYRHDPDMIAGHYKSRDHFLATTERDVRYRIRRDRSVKNFARDYAAVWPNSHTGHEFTTMRSPFALVDDVCPPESLRLPWSPDAVESYLAPPSPQRVAAFLAS